MKPVYLNVGCGMDKIKGFRNIDKNLGLHPDVLGDVTDLPYNDNIADVMLCFHVLEHLSYPEVREAFRELYRVLKPSSGKLRISMPDLKKCLKRPLKERNTHIYGKGRWMGDIHQTGFIESDIIELADEVGFSIVKINTKRKAIDLRHDWSVNMEFELKKGD